MGLLAGCRIYTDEVTNDSLWMNGQISTIINRQYRDRSLGGHSLGGGYDPVVKNDWILVKHPFPHQAHQLRRFKFYSLDGGGDQDQIFLSINGSDLLIHQFPGMLGTIEGQFALFDPKVGKDISTLFPPASAAAVFNRSRTKCLTLVKGEAMILDVLSATNGSPNALPRPSWTSPLLRLQKGGFLAHLSEDTSSLFFVSRGYSSPPSVIEVWSTNRNSQHFAIPIKQNGDEILDVDLVNGEILVLIRRLLSNGWQDSLEILNRSGETEHSTNILATAGTYWDPLRHEVFVTPDELWDYELNTKSNP